jgi:hypothetical protein
VVAGLSRVGDAVVDGAMQVKRAIPALALIPLMISAERFVRNWLLRRNSETGGLEDYAKLPAELPVMRRISDIRPGFM